MHLYNIHKKVALSNTNCYCPDTRIERCTPVDYTYFPKAFFDFEYLIDLDVIYFRYKSNAAKVITLYITHSRLLSELFFYFMKYSLKHTE